MAPDLSTCYLEQDSELPVDTFGGQSTVVAYKGDREVAALPKMHTLGHDFIPDPIHAGGLRYHGMSPLISHIYHLGLIEAVAKTQRECFEAGVRFARTEGIVPAPEPTHALAACIEEAGAAGANPQPALSH